ncbi:RALF-like protein [Medicago truncatula]|uniref:RALF-like protein n=1 Tax=Medicago truncatula TaxID=3880 RepID=A0A072UJ67_MEDTR|nr:RALF-like protein [Medicago truncatula]
MASKNCSLLCMVLFLCTMSFSTKTTRNIVGASKMYANEMGKNRKLLASDQRCRRERITVELNQASIVLNNTALFNRTDVEQPLKLNQTHEGKPENDPRCHNYL